MKEYQFLTSIEQNVAYVTEAIGGVYCASNPDEKLKSLQMVIQHLTFALRGAKNLQKKTTIDLHKKILSTGYVLWVQRKPKAKYEVVVSTFSHRIACHHWSDTAQQYRADSGKRWKLYYNGEVVGRLTSTTRWDPSLWD